MARSGFCKVTLQNMLPNFYVHHSAKLQKAAHHNFKSIFAYPKSPKVEKLANISLQLPKFLQFRRFRVRKTKNSLDRASVENILDKLRIGTV